MLTKHFQTYKICTIIEIVFEKASQYRSAELLDRSRKRDVHALCLVK